MGFDLTGRAALADVPRDAPGPMAAELRESDSSRRVTSGGGFTVDTQDRRAVVDFFNEVYMPALNAPLTWNGNPATCNAGDTPAGYRQATMDMVNYFRAMVALPADLPNDPALDAGAQQAALMFMANDDLKHSPPPSWLCFSESGKDAALRSNISLGHSGPRAIANGYMPENGDFNKNGSHRRWLLFPRQVSMGVGAAFLEDHDPEETNALYVISSIGPRPDSPEFVAWPPPGFVPFPVAFERWSFAVNLSANKVDLSQVQVSVSSDGFDVPITQHAPVEDFLADDTILWDVGPQGFAPGMKDQTYIVQITNFIVDGESKDYEYSFTVFDPARPTQTPAERILSLLFGEDVDPTGLDINADSVIDVTDLVGALLIP